MAKSIGRAVLGALFDRVRAEGLDPCPANWSGSPPRCCRLRSPRPAPPTPPPAAPRTTPPSTDTAQRSGATLSVKPPDDPICHRPGARHRNLRGSGRRAVRRVCRPRGWPCHRSPGRRVRVRLEGWVRAADLANPRDADVPRITAEDLRLNPERFVGQTVDWRLQFLAVLIADELRPELPPGRHSCSPGARSPKRGSCMSSSLRPRPNGSGRWRRWTNSRPG